MRVVGVHRRIASTFPGSRLGRFSNHLRQGQEGNTARPRRQARRAEASEEDDQEDRTKRGGRSAAMDVSLRDR